MNFVVVYLDVLIAVNLVINYIILHTSAHITGQKKNRLRELAGAAIGAAYAAVCVLTEEVVSLLPFRILVGVLMSITAFGLNKRTLRTTLFFFGITAAFAGIVFVLSYVAEDKIGFVEGNVYINLSLPLLAVATAAAYLILTLLFRPPAVRGSTPAKIMKAEVICGGKEAKFDVLFDTGCTLLDPVTNNEVLVANIDCVSPLLDPVAAREIKRGTDPADIITKCRNHSPPFRLIFCKSVSGEPEMLLAFLPEKLLLDGEGKRGVLVAVTSSGLSGDDNVRAIIGAQKS